MKKDQEKTEIIYANESNIFDEEVLYNSLNYSIFDVMKKKIVIVEGWTDKKLFKVALQKLPQKFKYLKDSFKDVGMCHAKGTKHIIYVTSILEAANRKCLILSDDDKPAKEKQKQFLKEKGYGIWKRYGEVLSDGDIITAEDFIKQESIEQIIEGLRSRFPSLPALTGKEVIPVKGILFVVNEWLKNSGLEKQDCEEFVRNFKENLFDEIRPIDIKPNYYEYLAKVASLMNKL